MGKKVRRLGRLAAVTNIDPFALFARDPRKGVFTIAALLRGLPYIEAEKELSHRKANSKLDHDSVYELMMAATEDEDIASRCSAEFLLESLSKQDEARQAHSNRKPPNVFGF